MKEISTNWTKEEFKAYLLLYCAHADFVVTEEEKELMKSKVAEKTFNNIRKEFKKDTDFERIQKIVFTAEKHNYSKDQIEVLSEEMKELFLADGKYDILEENILRGIKRVIK